MTCSWTSGGLTTQKWWFNQQNYVERVLKSPCPYVFNMFLIFFPGSSWLTLWVLHVFPHMFNLFSYFVPYISYVCPIFCTTYVLCMSHMGSICSLVPICFVSVYLPYFPIYISHVSFFFSPIFPRCSHMLFHFLRYFFESIPRKKNMDFLVSHSYVSFMWLYPWFSHISRSINWMGRN